ncbi:MAG: tetratricopeptide repeat protein [Deltaproteobacteria bacterium]|nr:tetratricopeptide repeat protein [Deltaproteobacteria bacterium]
MSDPGSWIAELQRRRVPRTLVAYLAVTFGALQGLDILVNALNLPHAIMTGLVVAALLGIPVTVALAWRYDLTAEGVVRTPAIPPAQPLAPAPRRLWPWLLGALGLVLALSGGAFWKLHAPQAALEKDRVAVLPFSVRGSTQYAYLREGMPDLLGPLLTRAGLRRVDGRALLHAVQGLPPDLDLEQAGEVARQFGAGLFLVGDVLEVKDKLQLHAQLYETGGAAALAEATFEGDAGALFTGVPELLNQLRPALVARAGMKADSALANLAGTNTTSLPALQAFLEGERLMRKNDFPSAQHAFQRAVAEDPAFTLAQYRLAVAASWVGDFPSGWLALEKALAQKDKVSAHERQLIEAFAFYWRGQGPQAEAIYRSILRESPDDGETWYQLGEVLFHCGVEQARSPIEARAAFERAIELLGPDFSPARNHLQSIAVMLRDREAIERELSAIRKDPTQGTPGLAWLFETALGREEEAKKDAGELANLNGQMFMASQLVWFGLPAARSTAALDEAAKMAKAPFEKRSVILFRAQILAVHGRPLEAEALLATADPAPIYSRAQMTLWPLLGRDKRSVQEQLAQLKGPDFVEKTGVPHLEAVRIHTYTHGLLASALGDAAATEADALALEATTDPENSPQGKDLARTIRANLLLTKGDVAGALLLFEQMTAGHPMRSMGFNLLTTAFPRWLRAEALRLAGRTQEALAFYESLDTNSEWVMAGFWAPERLRRAQVLESMGKREAAAALYRDFANLWADCEPQLTPVRDDAKTRLAMLAKETSVAAPMVAK